MSIDTFPVGQEMDVTYPEFEASLGCRLFQKGSGKRNGDRKATGKAKLPDCRPGAGIARRDNGSAT